jgi:hypothetical protein
MRLRFSVSFLAMLLGLLCVFCGCNPFAKTAVSNKSTSVAPSDLPNASVTPNTAGIDIFYIRVPYQNRDVLRDFWAATDEQITGVNSRELHSNGIRIGIQGAGMSPPLSRMLELKNNESPVRDMNVSREIDVAKQPDVEPLVSRQYQQLVPGKIAYLQPYSDAVPKVSRFWLENNKLVGKTYENVNPYISITAAPLGENEGGVLFNVLPVLHYGDAVLRMTSVHGYYAREMKRPRIGFDNLAVSVKLLPGQWLLIGPASENLQGIGHYFFTREVGETEQKIIAIRLSMVKN